MDPLLHCTKSVTQPGIPAFKMYEQGRSNIIRALDKIILDACDVLTWGIISNHYR